MKAVNITLTDGMKVNKCWVFENDLNAHLAFRMKKRSINCFKFILGVINGDTFSFKRQR